MYMGGLESSRKVFFALAILFAWKYINLWPNGLCFEYKGFYVQKTTLLYRVKYYGLYQYIELSCLKLMNYCQVHQICYYGIF
jgi:hypothetical protein